MLFCQTNLYKTEIEMLCQQCDGKMKENEQKRVCPHDV